jgi:hypothetical protein
VPGPAERGLQSQPIPGKLTVRREPPGAGAAALAAGCGRRSLRSPVPRTRPSAIFCSVAARRSARPDEALLAREKRGSLVTHDGVPRYDAARSALPRMACRPVLR